MILRAGEVFVNGLSGTARLGKSDLDVWAAIQENIAGLSDFFDLVVTRDRIPLIDYGYTFDVDSVVRPLDALLGEKALPVTIAAGPYHIVKKGAFNSLRRIELERVRAFGSQLRELDSLRYDWQPKLDDYDGETSWLSKPNVFGLDDATQRAARFLLGGLIFSGFAQASGTDHYIQPKRSRFFLSLTATSAISNHIGHDVEQPIFDEAMLGLAGTTATVHRLGGVPPVLPYLISKAPPTITAADLLKRALDFPGTAEGERYCRAVAAIRHDGVEGQKVKNAAFIAREDALDVFRPFRRLSENDGGFRVEASVGTDGPKVALSKDLRLPTWLRFWWNDHTPWGGIRKTFRRMWMAAEGFQHLERQVRDIWGRS